MGDRREGGAIPQDACAVRVRLLPRPDHGPCLHVMRPRNNQRLRTASARLYQGFCPHATAAGFRLQRLSRSYTRHQVPYNDVQLLQKAIEVYADRLACFIVEPIQGEAGVVVPDAGYLAAAAALCKKVLPHFCSLCFPPYTYLLFVFPTLHMHPPAAQCALCWRRDPNRHRKDRQAACVRP